MGVWKEEDTGQKNGEGQWKSLGEMDEVEGGLDGESQVVEATFEGSQGTIVFALLVLHSNIVTLAKASP